MNIVLFEDDRVDQLHPVTIGRPAYAISCGARRLIDCLSDLGSGPRRGIVRPYLSVIQEIDFPEWHTAQPLAFPCLLLNARLVPSEEMIAALRDLTRVERTGVVWSGSSVAAAWLVPPFRFPLPHTLEELVPFLKHLLMEATFDESRLQLFDYPHDIIRQNVKILDTNLQALLKSGRFTEIRSGVFAAPGATLGEYVVTDTIAGPVLLDTGAKVGPFCLLRGPAYVGHHARIIEYAAIKDAVSIGHTTKIGGEVEATVVEPYTNKQHHGFLGHSYIGSWVKLGAGTCNSDLKNTYGTIRMDYRGRKVATDMQFLGCILGDYAKTAINTGIFTGKTVGVCSMLYGFVTTNVPSYVSYARLFGQVTELPPEILIAAQQRMFARRRVMQRPCDIQLIYDMFEVTRGERQIPDEPLML